MLVCRGNPAAAASAVARNIVAARLATEAAAGAAAPPLKTLDDVPGPSSLPFIGPAVHFLPYIGKFRDAASNSYKIYDMFYKNYGPVVKFGSVMSKPPMIFCFDPEDMEQVLRQENQLPIRMGFDSLEYYRKHVKNALYDGTSGLLTDHGEEWKSFRSKVNPVMLQPKTIKQYATVLDEVAQDMVQRLREIRNSDHTIGDSFDTEMNKWALESIATVALGGRLGCLQAGLGADSAAHRLIRVVREAFEVLYLLDFQPNPWRYFATSTYKRALKIFDEQIEISEFYIKKAIEDMKKRITPPEEKSVLEKLLEIDEKVALIMATDMLFAGVDTCTIPLGLLAPIKRDNSFKVAHTMMFVLYYLAVNPEKQALLRKEVKSGVEKRSYLKACIKESMRLSPPVSGNMRRTTRDTRIGDYLIPKGIDIIFANEYVSRQESQYLRAKEFIPERWLVGKEDPLHYGNAHPMTVLPFGFGVRLCIGRRIAELEMETFLGRFVESFRVEWHGPPPKVKTYSVNYMLGPYNYVLHDAE